MLKNIGLCSALVATLLLTGCSQKEVDVDSSAQNQNAQTTEDKLDKIDTVSIDDSSSQKNGNYVMINGQKVFLENLYFAFDKFNLSDDMRSVSKSNADKMLAANLSEKIKLEGNCDEFGSDEYNYALGLKRAKAAKDALVADGVSSDLITMVSYGESNPSCTEHNKECWEQNRRVEYKVAQ